jgi:hypothetical protein
VLVLSIANVSIDPDLRLNCSNALEMAVLHVIQSKNLVRDGPVDMTQLGTIPEHVEEILIGIRSRLILFLLILRYPFTVHGIIIRNQQEVSLLHVPLLERRLLC